MGLAERRRALGYSQEELAHALGVDRRTIGRWETRSTTPQPPYGHGWPSCCYITPWDETPEWERQAARAVFDQVRQFLDLSDRHASRLTREQKSRFVATCWTAQMYKPFDNPKPGYVADWPDLPDWQWETDADIFEAIEDASK
ncbi:helix-turn-helix transcriptional regulator [Streptomyces sp. NPDC001537]